MSEKKKEGRPLVVALLFARISLGGESEPSIALSAKVLNAPEFSEGATVNRPNHDAHQKGNQLLDSDYTITAAFCQGVLSNPS